MTRLHPLEPSKHRARRTCLRRDHVCQRRRALVAKVAITSIALIMEAIHATERLLNPEPSFKKSLSALRRRNSDLEFQFACGFVVCPLGIVKLEWRWEQRDRGPCCYIVVDLVHADRDNQDRCVTEHGIYESLRMNLIAYQDTTFRQKIAATSNWNCCRTGPKANLMKNVSFVGYIFHCFSSNVILPFISCFIVFLAIFLCNFISCLGVLLSYFIGCYHISFLFH